MNSTEMITRAVILAGGKGTRMGGVAQEVPKAMLPIDGLTLLEHQLHVLKRYDIRDVILCTGYLSHVIENYFKDGSFLDMSIKYSVESTPLGTAGSLKEIEEEMSNTFILVYGDVMFDIDIKRFLEFHKRKRASLSLFTHPNDHPFDSDLIENDEEDKIVRFHNKPHQAGQYLPNNANAAIYLMEPVIFNYLRKGVNEDLARNVFPRLLDTNLHLYAYRSPEYVKDVGTPERLVEVEKDFISGKVRRKNLRYERPAIFLDRDGVINEEKNHLSSPDQLTILPSVKSAVKKINNSDYLSIIVTNQPVVARGECSMDEVRQIHNKLETELSQNGAMIDRILFCPHHPDKGFPGENPDYKINCSCRKPMTGMIDEAKNELNVDISRSYLVGDSTRDIETGSRAGITTIGVRTGYACNDGLYDAIPDYMFDSMHEAVDFIIDESYARVFNAVTEKMSKIESKPVITAIGGNARSGKSTLSSYLSLKTRKKGYKVLVIKLDNWLIPKHKRNKKMTVFDRYQIDLLNSDLENIIVLKKTVTRSVYDSLKRAYSSKKVTYSVEDMDLVIIDGVVALCLEFLRELSNFRIFMKQDKNTYETRLAHFYDQKGLNLKIINDIIKRRVDKEYYYIEACCQYADVEVVRNFE